jgi:superfamily II DNA or RNA helicase
MSIKVPLSSLSDVQRRAIARDIEFENPNTQKWIYPYYIDEKDNISLPFSYAVQHGFARPSRDTFEQAKFTFTGTLRDYQKEVKAQVLQTLNQKGSCVLALHVGWGKSVLAAYLVCKLRLKTLIVVNRLVLATQWKDIFKVVCPGVQVHLVKAKDTLTDGSLFIVNAINIPKLKGLGKIGAVICDEVHLICAQTLYKGLFCVHPMYLIGLSATPHRPDGLGTLIDLYFGEDRIHKPLQRKHTVYAIHTGYKFPFKIGMNGRIDWNSLLNAQAEHAQRNDLIIDIVTTVSNRYFLVLCKRITQGETLVAKLQDAGVQVTHLLGSKRDFDPESRVVVATTQKCGIGFSHNRLNALILATDVEEYFIQYLGRVFRTPETEPIVFDLVDQHPILKKHFSTRKKVYTEVGGTIETIRKMKSLWEKLGQVEKTVNDEKLND